MGPWDMMANYGNSALESNSIDQVEAWCINSSGSIAGISRSMSSFVEPVNKASDDKIPRINCFPGYPISTNRTGIRAALSFALGLIGLSAIPKNFPVAAFLIGESVGGVNITTPFFFFFDLLFIWSKSLRETKKMVKRSKLLQALDDHRGRDYDAEKQKKQVKTAEKRKRAKKENEQAGEGMDVDEDEKKVYTESIFFSSSGYLRNC